MNNRFPRAHLSVAALAFLSCAATVRADDGTDGHPEGR